MPIGSTGVAILAYWLFQFAFADTCSTITSGAMIGRTGFVGDLLYSVGVSGLIYPIVGHWVWGPDGWLALRGMHDFAGWYQRLSALQLLDGEMGDQPFGLRELIATEPRRRAQSGSCACRGRGSRGRARRL